jgi:succinoglycan biosynthesis protein ExoA
MTGDTLPRALVVIPCLNEEADIGQLLQSQIEACKGLRMHIVVADGGSTDRTPAIVQEIAAKHANVSLIHNPKRIQSAGINLAVTKHGDVAEILVRLDAHASYPPDYCQTLVAEQRATGAASVVVGLETVGKKGFQKAVAAAQNSKLGNGGSMHRLAGSGGRWVDHGHHAVMQIAAFRDVGGYDESFIANEDAELDARLAENGYRIWLTGKTVATYYPRSSPMRLFHQYFNHGYGRLRTMVKHRLRPRVRQLVPALIVPACALVLLTPLSGMAAVAPLTWVVVCLTYGGVLGIRAREPVVALSGPAAMIMHFAWSVGFWKALLDGIWSPAK